MELAQKQPTFYEFSVNVAKILTDNVWQKK